MPEGLIVTNGERNIEVRACGCFIWSVYLGLRYCTQVVKQLQIRACAWLHYVGIRKFGQNEYTLVFIEDHKLAESGNQNYNNNSNEALSSR